MKRGPAELMKRVLGQCGVGITNYRYLQELKGSERASYSLEFLRHLPEPWVMECLRLIERSHGQLHQDLLALAACGFKRDGFFVEFGATDGVELNNTLLLERDFGWNGVLAEPARCWHSGLRANRRCAIETRCVWTRSGDKLRFNEVAYAELSTIDAYNASDSRLRERKKGKTYEVETIALVELLAERAAPPVIDYLSIDTEGSEYDILNAFDFSKYRFRVISCEHNFSPARAKIRALLESNGYRRWLSEVSRFDDWYLAEEVEVP